MKRKVYLENKEHRQALAEYLSILKEKGALTPRRGEMVPVGQALGRVTAQPLVSLNSVPHYHAAAMDGIAVRAEDTYQARETTPVLLTLGENAAEVDTGDPLPEGYNAVIMVEEIQFLKGNQVEITAAAAPWQHVRAIGEDMIKGEVVLPVNHTVTAADLGAVIAAGLTEIPVRQRPGIAIMPTGTELVEAGIKPKAGQIVEFNSAVLTGYFSEWGAHASVMPMSKDDYELIRDRLAQAAARYDVVVVNAGSSAGREDYTASVLAELGEVVTHGVAIKPGKPVILGCIGATPVIGLPGYPVSTALTAQLFVYPLIKAMLGQGRVEAPQVEALLTRSLHSTLGMEEFVRVRLGQVGEKLVAAPLGRGAGVITTLVKADGLLVLDRLSEGRLAGEKVKVRLLRDLSSIKRTLMINGSHDMTLDIIDNLMREQYPGYSAASAHVGSLGGIISLKEGEAHCAGTHLLDPDSGEYNTAYVKKHLADSAVLVHLVYREQGLMLAPGNPKGITSLEGLTADGVIFINRQRGSGTRVLLDFHLKELGIGPKAINGYRREEFTHLSAAAAVLNGAADAALGIKAAAEALGLDFIPVARERYDLCIPRQLLADPLVEKLLAVIRSDRFRSEAERLGGYDASASGSIVWQPGKEEYNE